MVAFYPHFVSCSGQATLHDVVGRWFLAQWLFRWVVVVHY